MTIAQAINFYKQDTKKYEINKNKEFLTWLREEIERGYKPFIDINNLEKMINNIAFWYEIKYPEREMEFYEGVRYLNFTKIDSLSKYMDIKQLMYRLPNEQLKLLRCNYRSSGGTLNTIYNDKGKKIGFKENIHLVLKEKNDNFIKNIHIFVNPENGVVDISSIKEEIEISENIPLEELLNIFKEKYGDRYDYTELENCIYNHNCDVKLRRQILQLVALKILYYEKTIPERGYERAKRFINEFNKKLGLDISDEEINEIINRDYSKEEKHVKKNLKLKCKSLFKLK